jgi:hypothetical protein
MSVTSATEPVIRHASSSVCCCPGCVGVPGRRQLACHTPGAARVLARSTMDGRSWAQSRAGTGWALTGCRIRRGSVRRCDRHSNTREGTTGHPEVATTISSAVSGHVQGWHTGCGEAEHPCPDARARHGRAVE